MRSPTHGVMWSKHTLNNTYCHPPNNSYQCIQAEPQTQRPDLAVGTNSPWHRIPTLLWEPTVLELTFGTFYSFFFTFILPNPKKPHVYIFNPYLTLWTSSPGRIKTGQRVSVWGWYCHILFFFLCLFTVSFLQIYNIYGKYKLTHADTWATPWQHQQNQRAPSEDSDQPGYPPSLISLCCPLNG